ncbi:MAG: hypothetical protein DHS20C17_17850 [Cyclobacteriaceae bacterium]|nr:MAG: hypothetical protein DHS20C17_17850 [Cyclobacteriaceae bacterium]
METIKVILLTILTPLLISSGCEEDSGESIECKDLFELEIQESCTFNPERNTVDTFIEANGIYETVQLTSTKTVSVIRPESKTDNMPTDVVVPCNFPSFNFKEGQELVFSGNLMETFPTENVIGAQLELTSLKIKCKDK